MKKIVLLLIVPFLVLATNVYADSVFSDYYDYGTFDAQSNPSTSDWGFSYYDITTGGTSSYYDSNMDITFNGKNYTAHCLDPGLPRPQGDLTCKPINRNPAVAALGEMTAGGDDAVATLAYRIWATVNERTNQDKTQLGFKQTVEAYSKIMSDDEEAKTLYGEKFGLCSGSECASTDKQTIANKIFGENVELFQKAWSVAMAANDLGQYEYDKYEDTQGRVSVGSTSQTGQNVKIRLSSGGAVIKKEDIQVICSKGCSVNDFTWSNYSGTVDITVTSGDCKYELQFFYPTAGSYECTTNESNTQTLYTHVDETTTTAAQTYKGQISGDTSGTNQLCQNTCCTDAPTIRPGTIFGEVNNCCTKTRSVAEEYKLNDLFCKDEKMDLKWWKLKCNVEESIYESEINDFCKMYCTERVQVDLPGAVTASSGRYFVLEKNPVGNTSSPYITGNKRCRVKLDFNYWKDSYNVQITTQVKAFNDFQRHDAARETIDNMEKSTATRSFTIVCKTESDDGWRGKDTCTKKEGSKEVEWEESWSLDKDQKTIYISGTLYNYEVEYVERYTTIKQVGPVNEEENNFYNEWKIEKDKTPRLGEIKFPNYTGSCTKGAEMSEQCLWVSEQKPGDEDITYKTAWGQKVTDYDAYTELMNKIVTRLTPYISIGYRSWDGNLTIGGGKIYDEDSTCDGENRYYSEWVCTGLDSLTSASSFPEYQSNVQKFNMRKYINEYMDKLPNDAQNLFSAAASTAKKLEEDLDLCTNYFTKTDPNKIYQFNASAQFSYSQQYLSEKGELVRDEIPIPFTGSPGCVVSLASTGKTAQTEDPQYSKEYSKDPENEDDKYIKLTDLKDTTLDRVDWYSNKSALEPYFDEEMKGYKKMTNDGLLQAVCEWEEGNNRIYTLAQSGVVQKETTNVKNFTIHDRQYQIHLTTLEGKYETFWKVRGLGSNGKFDSFFMNYGKTCAAQYGEKESPSSINSMFTCTLNVEHEVVLTGYCNGVTNKDGDANCDPFKEGYELVNFKVVDPSDLFPSVSGSQTPSYEGEEYAHNWVKDPEGIEVLGIIESKGAKDTTYAPQNLSYAFTLTPQDMKHIKNYNETRIPHGGYTDFELKCNCPSNPLPLNSTESCSKCKSTFIENLSNGRVMINGRSEDVTGWANKNENLGSVRNGNNW
jgi:hypothetical protein